MKLLTHNMLSSRCLKGVVNGFPLKIIANEVKEIKTDFNPEFIERIIPKMDWPALCEAAKNVGIEDLPSEPNIVGDSPDKEENLRKIHHALLEVDIVQGELVCPETGRKFPISEGIPNMLCNEDEV